MQATEATLPFSFRAPKRPRSNAAPPASNPAAAPALSKHQLRRLQRVKSLMGNHLKHFPEVQKINDCSYACCLQGCKYQSMWRWDVAAGDYKEHATEHDMALHGKPDKAKLGRKEARALHAAPTSECAGPWRAQSVTISAAGAVGEVNFDKEAVNEPPPGFTLVTRLSEVVATLKKFDMERVRDVSIIKTTLETSAAVGNREQAKFDTCKGPDTKVNWSRYLGGEGDRKPMQLYDVTGRNALVVADKGGETTVLAAVLQVPREEAVPGAEKIRTYLQTVSAMDSLVPIPTHYNGEFGMVGRTSPSFNKHIGVGYSDAHKAASQARFTPNAAEAVVEEFCVFVWDKTVKIFPKLKEHRQQFLTKLGQAICYGDTATQLVSLTQNCAVDLHIDTKDGPYSIMLWVHAPSAGTLHGGHFVMPGAGIQVLPTDLTIVVIAAGVVQHGTAPITAVSPEGSGAARFGLSHFMRVPYMVRAGNLVEGAGGAEEGLEKLREAQVACAKKIIGHSRSGTAKKAAKVYADAVRGEHAAFLAEAERKGIAAGALCFNVENFLWPRDTVKCLIWI